MEELKACLFLCTRFRFAQMGLENVPGIMTVESLVIVDYAHSLKSPFVPIISIARSYQNWMYIILNGSIG